MLMRFLFNPSKNASFRIVFASLTRFGAFYPLKQLLGSSSSFVRFCKKHYRYNLDWKRTTSTTTTTTTTTKKTATMTVKAPDDEGIARRFWIKFRDEPLLAIYTPFVICLASGNLELETFRHFISQDVHFLRAFAQAYQLAEDCADDDEYKSAISEMRKHVLVELKLHKSFVQEWGIDPANESSATPATLKYTNFLLATASGKVEGEKGLGKIATPFEKTKVAAYTLSAVTPCMRLYAFLGKELRAFLVPDEGSHLYKKWIDNYSSEAFEALARQTEELLDKLSVSLTGEELDIMEKIYHQAMKLEIEFFTAQPVVQRAIVPLTRVLDPAEYRLILFSDFDLTCTILDSSAILAEIAILTAPKADQSGTENPLPRRSSADLRNSWGVLSRQYTEEYERCIDSIMPNEKVREFNYEGLSKAFEQVSDFEKRANARVIESGTLKGLNLEDIKKAGERLKLQDGCTGFFQTIVKNEGLKASVHILSYCWCDDLIRSAFSSGGLNVLNVHANQFVYEESISTGDIIKKVESPFDKVEAFKEILKNSGNDGKQLSIYIGDSVGDMLCLLEADVGIVVGSSPSLRRVGRAFGVSFVPLFSGLVKKQRKFDGSSCSNWKGLSGILYTVSSWAEIHALILGPRS
ncbi:LOW QUALITY PROTEIN: bifunctional TH2 protein, mitochondrial-like [Macadamia integrifolia]|uniref:LOW QUALITY PROTEIN: bifunctional TH2 protein, mitochondrial-like n=1 Tax=Macadamia integrifolia TaxID=60698 RepID=UPI001C4E4CC9|nr:LOW QUALITY PROTEIN: bifunctional TH2 protein, mitochondrial-like [Macadamia integrifolia]